VGLSAILRRSLLLSYLPACPASPGGKQGGAAGWKEGGLLPFRGTHIVNETLTTR
jgi:hypothetical protein